MRAKIKSLRKIYKILFVFLFIIKNTKGNLISFPEWFSFALISRHFIGSSSYFTWWMEMYQIKRLVLKNPWKFKIKIQFLEFWRKIHVKIQDFEEKMVSWIFNSISLNLFHTGSFIWDITFHNLKYLDKPIKCLEMTAKIKSVWKIIEIFLCIFTYFF